MRIYVSGTACQGKTTFINDFLQRWPQYRKSKFNYRDLITEKKHSKEATEELQLTILHGMCAEISTWRRNDLVIMDRGPLDNFVYTLWLHEKGKISKEFVDKCIVLMRESFRNVDMILFTPITKVSPIPIVDDGTRETDEEYIKEIDNLFKAMQMQHKHHDVSPFFPSNDVPGMLEIFGTRQERIKILELYIGDDGLLQGEDNSIINPTEVAKLERALGVTKKDPFAI